MAKFDKIQVLTKMKETGMVPVFYHSDAEVAKQVILACYKGGVRAFEFTNRGDFAHEVFAECVKFAAKECPEMAMGVGSVVDAPTASLYIQMGACFVVGPLLNADIAKVCNRRLVAYCPGCGSVSEYGPAFVKSVMAPCPWSKIMVTGGVSPDKDNLTAWTKAGAFCVGMGSKLFPKDIVQAKDWEYITNKCKESLSYIAASRK